MKAGKYEVFPQQDWMVLSLVEEQSPSGLVLPQGVDKTKDDSATFTVLAIGPGYYEWGKFIPSEAKIGDTVMVAAFGLGKIEIGGKKYIVGQARNIALILKREEVITDAGV